MWSVLPWWTHHPFPSPQLRHWPRCAMPGTSTERHVSGLSFVSMWVTSQGNLHKCQPRDLKFSWWQKPAPPYRPYSHMASQHSPHADSRPSQHRVVSPPPSAHCQGLGGQQSQNTAQWAVFGPAICSQEGCTVCTATPCTAYMLWWCVRLQPKNACTCSAQL